MNEISFIEYLKKPVNGVKPYSIFAAAGIALVLGLIDTVGCVVLIIAAFVFVSKGHRGLGMLLAVTNFVFPDALPLVDEAASIAAVILPLYMEWKKSGNIGETVTKTIESKQEYEQTRSQYAVNQITDSGYDMQDETEE